jgi:hypothetical protein
MHRPENFYLKESGRAAMILGYFEGKEVLRYNTICFNDMWKRLSTLKVQRLDTLIFSPGIDYDNLHF